MKKKIFIILFLILIIFLAFTRQVDNIFMSFATFTIVAMISTAVCFYAVDGSMSRLFLGRNWKRHSRRSNPTSQVFPGKGGMKTHPP